MRDRTKLNATNLLKLINENEKLMNVFNENDPDTIADTVITEMNKIVENLAPGRRVQK